MLATSASGGYRRSQAMNASGAATSARIWSRETAFGAPNYKYWTRRYYW
jgi:hypothetical protein